MLLETHVTSGTTVSTSSQAKRRNGSATDNPSLNHTSKQPRLEINPSPLFHSTNYRPLSSSTAGNLWCGDIAFIEADHAEIGMIRGHVKQRPRRGFCEIRGHQANLWGPVARALGFDVSSHRYSNPTYDRWLRAAGIQASVKKLGVNRLRNNTQWFRHNSQSMPAIVFTDGLSLPPIISQGGPAPYWTKWVTTHVFFILSSERPQPPAGWQESCAGFNHAALGGSTTANCSIYCWFPPLLTPPAPVSIPRQPWRAMRGCVDRMIHGPAVPAPNNQTPLTLPSIIQENGSEQIEEHGLFPHTTLTIPV